MVRLFSTSFAIAVVFARLSYTVHAEDSLQPEDFGARGLCVVGCTPYVDPDAPDKGILKYHALVEDMVADCDVVVHIGDTKPGKMPCNRTLLTNSVHIIMDAAAEREDKPTMVLYAPGDNELNDCHRHGSREDNNVPSDFYKAADARQFLVDDLDLYDNKDLTKTFEIENHDRSHLNISGTDDPYSCDFDKYVELNNYAIATLEVVGSHYYLDDERNSGYPLQDEVDPLEERLPMYLNANDCALEWIQQSATKASSSKKRALFFLFHASFYRSLGRSASGGNGVGSYYSAANLRNYTRELNRDVISRPYQPLFDKLTETAFNFPNMTFYVVHSDGHRFQTFRLNPTMHNRGPTRTFSHHNMMLQMVEGASRALTMYTKFTVDSDSFQPVTTKQEWSKRAYDEVPQGHSWIPY